MDKHIEHCLKIFKSSEGYWLYIINPKSSAKIKLGFLGGIDHNCYKTIAEYFNYQQENLEIPRQPINPNKEDKPAEVCGNCGCMKYCFEKCVCGYPASKTQEKGLVADKHKLIKLALDYCKEWYPENDEQMEKSGTLINFISDVIIPNLSTFTAKASIENVKLPEKKETPILNSEQAMLENLEVIGWNACHEEFMRVLDKEKV